MAFEICRIVGLFNSQQKFKFSSTLLVFVELSKNYFISYLLADINPSSSFPSWRNSLWEMCPILNSHQVHLISFPTYKILVVAKGPIKSSTKSSSLQAMNQRVDCPRYTTFAFIHILLVTQYIHMKHQFEKFCVFPKKWPLGNDPFHG